MHALVTFVDGSTVVQAARAGHGAADPARAVVARALGGGGARRSPPSDARRARRSRRSRPAAIPRSIWRSTPAARGGTAPCVAQRGRRGRGRRRSSTARSRSATCPRWSARVLDRHTPARGRVVRAAERGRCVGARRRARRPRAVRRRCARAMTGRAMTPARRRPRRGPRGSSAGSLASRDPGAGVGRLRARRVLALPHRARLARGAGAGARLPVALGPGRRRRATRRSTWRRSGRRVRGGGLGRRRRGGRELRAMLERRGHRRPRAARSTRAPPTVVKTRIVAGDSHTARQQVVRVDRGARVPAGAAASRARLAQHSTTAARGARAVVLSDYGYDAVTPALARARVARAGARAAPWSAWTRATGSPPTAASSARDAERGRGRGRRRRRRSRRRARPGARRRERLRRTLRADHLIVTRGRDGLTLWNARRRRRASRRGAGRRRWT